MVMCHRVMCEDSHYLMSNRLRDHPNKGIIMVNLGYSLLVGILLLPLALQAEVYRTVDEQGNVTYTDTPPANSSEAEKVDIQPGPSQESISDTMQRNRAIRKAMEEAQEKRLEKEVSREERIKKAEEAVEEAKQRLAEMEKLDEDDRQYLQGGKSYIRPDYYERIRKARKALEEAKKRLRKMRGY
jgi:chaperonin cofactor prefoldin